MYIHWKSMKKRITCILFNLLATGNICYYGPEGRPYSTMVYRWLYTYYPIFCIEFVSRLSRRSVSSVQLMVGRRWNRPSWQFTDKLDAKYWEVSVKSPINRRNIVISVSVRSSVRLFCWRVVVCVRFSETTQPIYPMMIPINWGNRVDVQRVLYFDLDPSMTAGQGHKILRFCAFRCLTGKSLCSLLLRIYLTKFSNADDNLPVEKNVDLQHIHHFDLHPSMTAGQGHIYFNFVNLGCCLGMNPDICRGHIRSRATDLI